MFSQKLNDAIKEKNSRLCVGLDPRLSQLPHSIIQHATREFGSTPEAAGAALTRFNQEILTAVVEHAACVKLQIAFYELFGPAGMQAFWDTVEYAHSLNFPVIADAKRGDIGSTAEAYAQAYLGGGDLFGTSQTTLVDAMTVNPFLGADTLEPFFDTAQTQEKGLFVLVKTSNPGSGDIQDLQVDGKSISLRITDMLTHSTEQLDSHGYGLAGAVVGATYPEAATQLRQALPHSIFLVPGIGAQGGDPALLKNFFNDDSLGAIVNSSRGITFPFEPTDQNYQTLIAQAAQETNAVINTHIK